MIGDAPLSVWQIIKADLYRYGSGVSFRAFARHYLSMPGFKYIFWMRLANDLRKRSRIARPGYWLCRLTLHHYEVKYGIAIPYNTQIGPGLYIGHYGGIVINHAVVMGRDCNVNHCVTIGAKYGGRNPGTPVIGNRVYLGPGCKIFGGLSVGSDVAVGANAVVVTSVPDAAVVTGVPGKIISLKGSGNYVVNTDYP